MVDESDVRQPACNCRFPAYSQGHGCGKNSTNPTLIVEVVSDSTEAYDRGKKFEHYRQIPSLREYLLVSQNEPRIEQFIRQQKGFWLLKEATGLEASLELPSLQIALPHSGVFARVKFTPGPIRPQARPRLGK